MSREWQARAGALAALVVLYVAFALLVPGFASMGSVETILRQTTVVGIAALGMTLVIVAGGIDLSVGSVIALSTVVIALLLNRGLPPPLAALGGLAAAGTAGLANGLAVTRLRVVPFIVTLGSLLVIRGAAKGLAGEQKIDAPLTWLNDLLAALPPDRRWMLFPPGVWLLALLALAVGGLLRYFRLGRHLYAVGSNERAARLSGVRIERVKVAAYGWCGGFAGLAGLMQFSRLTVGDPTVALGAELDVIAAVVIGGGSLAGGEGSVSGSLIGALIMAVIRSGSSQLGLPNWVQEMVTGTIIVVAVALDQFRRRRFR